MINLRAPKLYCLAREPFNLHNIFGKNVCEDVSSLNYKTHVIGRRIHQCNFCHAFMWDEERTAGSESRPRFSSCCLNGTVVLPSFKQPPEFLYNLLLNDDVDSKDFRNHIRAYNSVLSFSSLSAEVDEKITNSKFGAYNFRICGTIHHNIGSLIPKKDESPRFAQIYIYDNNIQTELRTKLFPDIINKTILNELQKILFEINPFVKTFVQVGERMKQNPYLDVQIEIKKLSINNKCFDTPQSDEIAVLIMNKPEIDGKKSNREVIVFGKNSKPTQISELHSSYDPLSYVLLFMYGEKGWAPESFKLNKSDKNFTGNKHSFVSCRQFYSYILHDRPNSFLQLFGRLFQQFIVDQYAKIEIGRLNFIRNNQDKLRVEMYKGLLESIAENDHKNLGKIGKRYILPSSFVGGPRHMHQLYQDAMSVVRVFGKPDLFLTMTCNPQWEEIKQELLATQCTNDRPDIVVRIFDCKANAIRNDIFKYYVFGTVDAYIWVIEFQKRGLPHMHMLFILAKKDKLKLIEDYDRIISAELPDPNKEPNLFEIVSKLMMHGPCGTERPNAPCMIDGKCSKGFPKQYSQVTHIDKCGNIVYKRRPAKYQLKNGKWVDNRYVVPYNPYLLKKYNCHINLEVCNTKDTVKYLYKYVYKGHDRCNLQFSLNEKNDMHDEIQLFQDSRYISSTEAIQRIFSLPLHGQSPSTFRLNVHLPFEESIIFNEDEIAENIVKNKHFTTLTAWFVLNTVDKEANSYYYQEIPTFYVWNESLKKWTKREKAFKVIGRIDFVHPAQLERYYLRVMLLNKKGAKSFDEIKTVENVVYPSFQAAAAKSGFIHEDDEWDVCLKEAESEFLNTECIRELFALILINGAPANPQKLLFDHIDALCEDYLYEEKKKATKKDISVSESMKHKAMYSINVYLNKNGRDFSDFEGMPEINFELLKNVKKHSLIDDERNYNTDELTILAKKNTQLMNREQFFAYKTILASVNSEKSKFFCFLICIIL